MGVVPVRIRLGDLIHQRDHRIDDVIDVGKVPFHLAVVVDLHRPPFEDRFSEFKQGHIGTSPRPIDGKESQTGAWQVVQVCITVGEHLVGLFGRCVQAHRMIGVMLGRKRLLSIQSINARAAGKDQVLDLLMPAAFENRQRSVDVRLGICERILERITHSGLGGQVHDAIESARSKQSRDALTVLQMHLVKLKIRLRRQKLQTALLKLHIVVIVHAVDADDTMA